MRGLVIAALGAALFASAALAGGSDPIKRHTAADMAKARSIVFKRAELGADWTRDTSQSNDDDPDCSYFHIQESDLVETGYAEATFNHTSGATIGSEASIYGTAAQARTTWTRHVRPALARCLAEEIRKQSLADGDKVQIVSTKKLAFPTVSPRTAAYRIVVRLTPKGRTTAIPITVDTVFLERGRILALLGVISPGVAPPLAADVRLARVLDARMRA
jgi:hypothetical protein